MCVSACMVKGMGGGYAYQHDEQVDGHVDDGAADEHAEVLSDVFDVEREEVREDEEEDTDGRQLDQEGDDLHDNLLDLRDGAEKRGVRSLDQGSDDDGRNKDCEKLVVGQRADHVVGDLASR